jgi:hypothetical protein
MKIEGFVDHAATVWGYLGTTGLRIRGWRRWFLPGVVGSGV